MACPYEHDIETAERYVRGALPEDERTAFEAHYFECERCLADVRALQDLWQVLDTPRHSVSRDPGTAGGRLGRLRLGTWSWVGLAAAATVVLAVVGLNGRRRAEPTPTQTPQLAQRAPQPAASPAPGPSLPAAPQAAPAGGTALPGTAPTPGSVPPGDSPPVDRHALLQQLAVVVAPPYLRLATRGSETSTPTAFDAAMAHYSAGRYALAADRLRALAAGDTPAASQARFFLGICELMEGRLEPAREIFEQVAASGVPPYADEAHFYLAKAALRSADVETARRELAVAAERDAGPEGEAARLLERLTGSL